MLLEKDHVCPHFLKAGKGNMFFSNHFGSANIFQNVKCKNMEANQTKSETIQ